jgi:hypothetical protein
MPSTLSFPILGRSFRARGVTPALVRWLESYWHFPQHELAPHPYGIDLRVLAGPAGAASFEDTGSGKHAWRGGELPWKRLGRAWEVREGRGGVRAWHSATGSRIVAHGLAGGSDEVAYALFLAIGHALCASGLVCLHAAAVARDGRTLALLGRTGTGKSSTLVQAVRAGWTPLAEDTIWLDPATLRFYGWDRGVHLWPEARERFAPELVDREWEVDSRGKLMIPYEALGAPAAREGVLTGIVLLERDGTRPSAWEDLAPRDAVRAIWEAVGVPLYEEDRPPLERWTSAAVSRLELRRLRLGSSPLPL